MRRGSPKPSSSHSGSYLDALPKDFREFLLSLIEKRVRFLLVGGHAVALHGAPRATLDLDVFVGNDAANLSALEAALYSFGFPEYARATSHLASGERFLMIGEKPLRIDILNAVDGLTFDEAWSSRVEVPFGSEKLSVIGLDALVKNKSKSGRTKDLLDIELLRERGVLDAS
jgi:hypothetical protein